MKLTALRTLHGQIELITGLHIGSGNNEMHIGGNDNPVIKNPVTGAPYIPGSSIKGKMRSLLEWELGVVGITGGRSLGFKDLASLQESDQSAGKNILRLFGGAPDNNPDDQLIEEIGPTRLAFWDCNLDPQWAQAMKDKNLLLTELKMENTIDRIAGVAKHPRNTERVPASAVFDFRLSLRVHDSENLLDTVLKGLRLVEITGLGGSSSRGYGKIKFKHLSCDDESIQERLNSVQLFRSAA